MLDAKESLLTGCLPAPSLLSLCQLILGCLYLGHLAAAVGSTSIGARQRAAFQAAAQGQPWKTCMTVWWHLVG